MSMRFQWTNGLHVMPASYFPLTWRGRLYMLHALMRRQADITKEKFNAERSLSIQGLVRYDAIEIGIITFS